MLSFSTFSAVRAVSAGGTLVVTGFGVDATEGPEGVDRSGDPVRVVGGFTARLSIVAALETPLCEEAVLRRDVGSLDRGKFAGVAF
jgi:hypothetical protein